MAAFFCCLVLLACEPSPSFYGDVVDPPRPAPDFALTDQYRNTFRLSDQRGKVVLLFFCYTSSTDVCPATLRAWRQVHDALGADAAAVRFVLVTVDPRRDAPERLLEHMALFSPDFIGLTGELEELEPVYQAYGVYREEIPRPGGGDGYRISHTASVYVIDPDGYWRLHHIFGTPPEEIVHDLQQLMD
ncbi:MAG: SCO family protein [Anaerolineae bacterium]|nr:SCO family protein [Anaerolineae bacterium]